MPDLQPVVVTVEDTKNPILLVRVLRVIADNISSVNTRLSKAVDQIKQLASNFNLSIIRDSLQATGSKPLNVTALRGVLGDPQLAGLVRFPTTPTGLLLQSIRDTQAILVQNGSAYDLYTVVGGNPNTLIKLVSGLGSGGSFSNMMTTDTAQNVTGTKTFTVVQILNNAIALQAKDAGGTTRNILQLDGSNVTNLNSDGTGATITLSIAATPYLRIENSGQTDILSKLSVTNALRLSAEVASTATYTITGTGFFVGVTHVGATTVKLPASPALFDSYVVLDVLGQGAANNITVNGNGNNIDGAATLVINTNYGVSRVTWTGSIWKTW